jgi:hypothetical protein
MQISIDPNAATMATSRRNAGLGVFFNRDQLLSLAQLRNLDTEVVP